MLLFFLIISYNFEPSYKFLYFYKIPIISYKLDIAGIFSTRMHQNEYLFSKNFRGWYPRTPDLYWDPAVMPTLHAVLSQLAHCNAFYVQCSMVSLMVSREMTVRSKMFLALALRSNFFVSSPTRSGLGFIRPAESLHWWWNNSRYLLCCSFN